MDFDLSADQEALREAARILLDRYATHDALRARVGTGTVVGTLPGAGEATGDSSGAPSGYDRAAWAAMADQGWLALEVAEGEGGLGLGMVEVAVLAEEIGRRLVSVPYLPTILAIGALSEPTAREHKAAGTWLEALSSGASVACVALCAPGVLRADHNEGADVLLQGRTAPALYAPSADVAVLVTPDALFAVDLEAHGRPAALSAMDRTRELGVLEFDSTPAVRLGDTSAATLVLDRAAAGWSAEMLGAADHVLAMTVAYAKDRVQFGKPIGSFQAIKHMLADALVDVEGMRSTAYYAAWCAAADDDERSMAASMAKAWCSDASRRVMATGLQVHGGIGFTWEHDMHLFLKRAQLDQVTMGDAPYHRDRIAGLLRARLAGGDPVAG
ncbi:MAG TPA: acyl-CoA dehydrogenase family protein [Acidimicrobiales bacterium]|nr:acyl-CoA dehydrogenase family protein [Acidimicrobiales bacterium]